MLLLFYLYNNVELITINYNYIIIIFLNGEESFYYHI